MSLQEMVKDIVQKGLPDAHVEVNDLTGTDDHLGLFVVSDEFKGKMLLDQHQMIMDLLKESLKEKVHAVQIKTMTKEKYQQQKE